MKIKSLSARPIIDSRAEWTVEATIELKNGIRVTASVPQGKSTGSSEANTLPVSAAVKKIEQVIAPLVKRKEPRDQKAFDDLLIALDGTPMKSRLGGNTILACSIAYARAIAMARDKPLWHYIREVYTGSSRPGAIDRRLLPSSRGVTHPRLFMNLINGGLHGGSNLNIQEYVVIPKTRTFKESAQIGLDIYNELKEAIERSKGKQATNLGDEGGFAPDFKDDLEPLHILHAVVKKLKLDRSVDFGMDAAATNIKKLERVDLFALYAKLAHDPQFIYLEDPFGENDFDAFAELTARFGKKFWITGDDLTTTNVRRMEVAHAKGAVNAVIIKPNQIGSVSEALDAVRAARRYGWAVVASHRSGETGDDFIADFAYGVAADGIKLGAPARGERVAKYNRLLEIEAEL